MIDCIVVGAGGFIGAVCRYLIGLIPLNEGGAFPVKTFLINIAGSFVIGIIAALALKNSALNPRAVLFLKVGICGGFTTFSSFALETGDLIVMMTDGVADAIPGGMEGVRQAILSARAQEPRALCRSLIERALRAQRGAAGDDMTVMCVRIVPTGARERRRAL